MNRTTAILLRVLAGTGLLLALSGTSWGIPSYTNHLHGDKPTTWMPPGSMTGPLHQHRDKDALTGGNGKYIGYSAWDNRDYRLEGQFGHGYMAEAARYLYEADFPALSQTDFDSAVGLWETLVNGKEANTNGVPINISLNFDPVKAGAHEIDVIWRDIGAADDFALAFWDPATTDFTFDSDPTRRVPAPVGYLIRSNGSTDPWGTFSRVFCPWYYGGSGDPSDVTRNFDLLEIATGDEFLNAYTRTFAAYDFYTISLHEIGHAWGLDHFGTDLMREDIAGFVMRTPDAGSLDGAKDLYAIAVPEPLTLAGLLAAGLPLAGYIRKRRRDITA
jgi:hypothetical protein